MAYITYLTVDFPAIHTNLSACSSEWADVAHLDHARREVAGEGRVVAAVLPHQRVLRPVVEELLVRVEEAPLRHQILVIVVVEYRRRLDIQRSQVVVAAARGRRAVALAEGGEGGVDVGVVVDVGPEGDAAGLADGVAAGERRQVAGVEALVREGGDELGEAGGRAGEVAVGRAEAGGGGVPPPQRHRPCRSPKL